MEILCSELSIFDLIVTDYLITAECKHHRLMS